MSATIPTNPLVSVVMAFRNGARYLDPAIASVLGQSHGALELILCDDGSTDAAPSVVADWAARDVRVRCIRSEVSGGPGAARNRGFDAARGDWIAIVDADDVIHPDRIATLLAAARDHGAGIVADDLGRFGDDRGGTILEPLNLTGPWLPDAADLLSAEAARPAIPVGYLKPLVSRGALGAMRYRDYMTIGEDFDLLLRLFMAGARGVVLPQALYLYRRHGSSISHRLAEPDIAGMLRAMDDLDRDMPEAANRLAGPLAERRAALDRARAFASLVARIKARDPRAATVLLGSPSLARPLVAAGIEGTLRRIGPGTARAATEPVTLSTQDHGPNTIRIPAHAADWTARDVAEVARRTGAGVGHVRVAGRAGLHALGFVPGWRAAELTPPEDGWTEAELDRIAALPGPVARTDAPVIPGRVHVRTPTYRRPAELERCLRSLIDQTHADWVCDVFDDDPDGAGRAVVAALGDPRIRYRQNPVQRFASGNIDQCFTRTNPHRAEYFCVLEDDNFLLPAFLEKNISAARDAGVEIVFRNQLVEFGSGTDGARLSRGGLLDAKLTERRYDPDHFRLAILADIGVSNGGLFWSVRAVSDLEIQVDCSATLQEYYRTFAIEEPIFVAMEPLAVWAENGEATTRDLGGSASWLRRELALKAAVVRLRRRAWRRAGPAERAAFLDDPAFSYPREDRARGLVKSLIRLDTAGALPPREVAALVLRGLLIRLTGRPESSLGAFLTARSAARPSASR
ncbi:glycosyltransferase [Rhodobacterales bacterium HKCCE2091]|nr:glycosyltransferase [Rhodobacterales bacterium HKCCE2091]